MRDTKTPPLQQQTPKRNSETHYTHIVPTTWFHILKRLPLKNLLNFRLSSWHFEYVTNRFFIEYMKSAGLLQLASRYGLSQREAAAFHSAMHSKLAALNHTIRPDTQLRLSQDYGFAFFLIQGISLNGLSRIDEEEPWYIDSCRLDNVQLDCCYLPRCEFINSEIDSVTFSGVVMNQSEFTGCKITNSTLSNFDAQSSILNCMIISDTKTRNVNLTGSTVSQVQFSNSSFNGAQLKHCRFLDCHFENVSLAEASTKGSTFYNVTFVNCNLLKSQIENATLSGVHFENCTMNDGSIKKRVNVPIDARLTKSLRRPKHFLFKELPESLTKLPSSSHEQTTESSGESMSNPQCPQLPSVDIFKEYTSWKAQKLGHWNVRISSSAPENTALCKIAYQLTRSDSADILYFLWIHKLPLLSELSNFDSQEADEVRERLCNDISGLLSLIHPMLLYFASDIMSNFQGEDDEKPSHQRRDFTPNLLGLAIASEHPVVKRFLCRSTLVLLSQFKALFDNKTLHHGKDLLNKTLDEKIAVSAEQISSLQTRLPEAVFFKLVSAFDDFMKLTMTGHAQPTPEEFVHTIITEEDLLYAPIALQFVRAKLEIENYSQSKISNDMIERITQFILPDSKKEQPTFILEM